MDWEYLHLITHSFPIVLSIAGSSVGFFGWSSGREELERWGILALLIAGIFVIPAYVTGLAAADVPLDRTFVRPSAVQTHRFASTWASLPLLLAGVLAGFSLLDEADDRRLRRFVLVVGALGAAVTAWAALLGSRIEHGAVPTSGLGLLPATGLGLLPATALGLLGGLVTGRRSPEAGSVEERARRLHREAIVVDGHNDLPWRIRDRWGLELERVELDRRLEEGHTDLVRLREGGVDVQFWAAYVPVRYMEQGAYRMTLEQIDLIERLTERYPDVLEMAYSASDVRRIVDDGRIASMIGVEGGHAIENSLDRLRELYEAGARYMTFTHSATLDWVDAAGDEARHGGLTEFGREVVREMNRLGMMVDISHVTAEAMRDVLDASSAPVIFSHSSCRALADHPRNVPDDVLARLAENGGVVMVNFYSGFLLEEGACNIRDIFRDEARIRAENPDPDDLARAKERWQAEHPTPPGDVGTIVDHIDHVVRVAGIDHVGLGSDFDGVAMLPAGMEDVSKLPAITVELVRRGYSDDEAKKILGGNLLRVLRRAEELAEAESAGASEGR